MTRRGVNYALKAATRKLVEHCGGQTYAAEQTRVPQSNLSDYGSNQKPERFMPADVILDLERAAGDPILTRELAEQQGFVLVALAVIANGAGVSACTVKLVEAFGPMLAEIKTALEVSVTDADERHRLAGLLKPIAQAVAEMTAALNRVKP